MNDAFPWIIAAIFAMQAFVMLLRHVPARARPWLISAFLFAVLAASVISLSGAQA